MLLDVIQEVFTLFKVIWEKIYAVASFSVLQSNKMHKKYNMI